MKRLKDTFIAPTVWLSAVVLFLAIAPLEAFGRLSIRFSPT